MNFDHDFALVLSIDYRSLPYYVFDLTNDNPELQEFDIADAQSFSEYVSRKIRESDSSFGIGRYNENRTIYDHSDVFSGGVRRRIHLGIDLWAPSGTKVFAPLKATVHSFNNNIGKGDYGPTIILQHELGGETFYTLYGHLSEDSLEGLEIGQEIEKGQEIARIGNFPINGDWPAHLHFQIITDMLGKKGDFFGVASADEREKFLKICPDPNLILQIPGLD